MILQQQPQQSSTNTRKIQPEKYNQINTTRKIQPNNVNQSQPERSTESQPENLYQKNLTRESRIHLNSIIMDRPKNHRKSTREFKPEKFNWRKRNTTNSCINKYNHKNTTTKSQPKSTRENQPEKINQGKSTRESQPKKVNQRMLNTTYGCFFFSIPGCVSPRLVVFLINSGWILIDFLFVFLIDSLIVFSIDSLVESLINS